MALIGHTPTSWTGSRSAFLLLFAAAVLTLVPAWAVQDEPLRVVLFFACGLLAGAAGVLAWSRLTLEPSAGAHSADNASSGKTLSWTDLATALPDPAIVLDESSAILNYNTAARGLFARLRHGVPLEHVDRDPELIAAVNGALEQNEKRSARLVSRGGVGQRLIATVTPLGGGDHQKPIAVLITILDQSEQHRLLEMRSDFIANASHELRTPLASVRGFIETLQGPARNDEAA